MAHASACSNGCTPLCSYSANISPYCPPTRDSRDSPYKTQLLIPQIYPSPSVSLQIRCSEQDISLRSLGASRSCFCPILSVLLPSELADPPKRGLLSAIPPSLSSSGVNWTLQVRPNRRFIFPLYCSSSGRPALACESCQRGMPWIEVPLQTPCRTSAQSGQYDADMLTCNGTAGSNPTGSPPQVSRSSSCYTTTPGTCSPQGISCPVVPPPPSMGNLAPSWEGLGFSLPAVGYLRVLQMRGGGEKGGQACWGI